jgi:hypothetical protein
MSHPCLIILEDPPREKELEPAPPEPVVDIFNQIINPGDLVMYPVNTFMRFAVVDRVRPPKELRMLYFMISRYVYNEELRRYEFVDPADPRTLAMKKQMTSLSARSIIKITAEDILKAALPDSVKAATIEKSQEIRKNQK